MAKHRRREIDYLGWLAIGVIMIFFSWGLFIYLHPIIIEANCSEVASETSSLNNPESSKLADSDYYTLKAKCLEETRSTGNKLTSKIL